MVLCHCGLDVTSSIAQFWEKQLEKALNSFSVMCEDKILLQLLSSHCEVCGQLWPLSQRPSFITHSTNHLTREELLVVPTLPELCREQNKGKSCQESQRAPLGCAALKTCQEKKNPPQTLKNPQGNVKPEQGRTAFTLGM